MRQTARPEDELRELAEVDLRCFLEQAWPIVVPQEPFQGNWHIDAACEHLMALLRGEFWNLLINWPPRCSKSTVCGVMFPAWAWLQDPSLRVMNASYGHDLAQRDSLATRRLIQSDWYQSRWGDRFALKDDQNVKTRWENDKGGMRLATSTTGAATGEGADLLIVDDPHNVNEAESEVERRKVITWYNVTMPSRTGRGGRAMKVVIGQRVHEEDLSADIIKKGVYVHMCLPMEYETASARPSGWGAWKDPRTEEGELLWPARFSEKVIAETLRPPHMTSHAYAGQFQQRPAPVEGGMFKRADWKFYKESPHDLVRRARLTCMSWDMTFKETDGGSYVVGTAWAAVDGCFYLLARVRDRMGFAASRQAVKSMAAAWPSVAHKLVEDKANGSAIIDDLRQHVPGLKAIEPEGGKEARANRMAAYVESHNVFLPESAPWVEEWIEEFRTFPNGAHDDQVDSASQAINWMAVRLASTFPPEVIAHRRSADPAGKGERYRDPRAGEEPIVVGYSERGDMRRLRR